MVMSSSFPPATCEGSRDRRTEKKKSRELATRGGERRGHKLSPRCDDVPRESRYFSRLGPHGARRRRGGGDETGPFVSCVLHRGAVLVLQQHRDDRTGSGSRRRGIDHDARRIAARRLVFAAKIDHDVVQRQRTDREVDAAQPQRRKAEDDTEQRAVGMLREQLKKVLADGHVFDRHIPLRVAINRSAGKSIAYLQDQEICGFIGDLGEEIRSRMPS